MAQESSFDIVSQFDEQELVNAIDIAMREVITRYDLKNSNSSIKLEEGVVVVHSQDEYKLKAVVDVLMSKAVKRGLSVKIFDPQKIEAALGGTAKQTLRLRQGLTADQCRDLNKKIRERFKKIKTQIQGDTLRVFDKSRDTLQEVIAFVKGMDYEVPLQFQNYR